MALFILIVIPNLKKTYYAPTLVCFGTYKIYLYLPRDLRGSETLLRRELLSGYLVPNQTDLQDKFGTAPSYGSPRELFYFQ